MKHIREFTINEDFSPPPPVPTEMTYDTDLMKAIRDAIIDQLRKSEVTDEILSKPEADKLVNDLTHKIYTEVAFAKPKKITESKRFKDSLSNVVKEHMINYLFKKIIYDK